MGNVDDLMNETGKKRYEIPKAMSMHSYENWSKGSCNPSGSGDSSLCTSGQGAGDLCYQTGSSATSTCDSGSSAGISYSCTNGSGAVTTCDCGGAGVGSQCNNGQ